MLEVEREELERRAKALSTEEIEIFIKEIPTVRLIEEVKYRTMKAEEKLRLIENYIKKGAES